MRTLTVSEIEETSGGVGVGGAVLGAVTGGVSSAMNGGNAGQIASAALLGGVSGFFGCIATAGFGRAVSAMFGTYSVGLGVASGAAGS